MTDRDLNHLHPNAGSVRIGDSVYVVSGEIESRGVHTTQIERTTINANGSITPWEVVGNLPASRDQATVAATANDIYIIGNHPGDGIVTRVRLNPDGTIGERFVENSLVEPRYNGGAFIHENWLWQVGGANNNDNPPHMASTEYAAINPDGSLGQWKLGPPLNAPRTNFALAKTDRYVYVISGQDVNAVTDIVERTELLPGGHIGPWEVLPISVPALSVPAALVADGCIYYVGGTFSGTEADTYCLRLLSNGDIGGVILQPEMTLSRQEPDVFRAGDFIYVTGGAGDSSGGLNGWQVTERAPLVRSPESGRVVFRSDRAGNFDIYRLDADGSPPVRLTFESTVDEAPALSPDGAMVAYRCDEQICTMGTDGTNKQIILASEGTDPAWSTDGKRIAVSAADKIAVMNADGSGLNHLTTGLVDENPVWFPDGQKIAFNRRTGAGQPEDIFVINCDGSGLARLTNNGTVNDVRPQWSRDGARILFSSNRFGNYQIFSMSADGNNQYRLVSTVGDDFMDAVSPQGHRIVFSSDKDGNRELYSINANGIGMQRLTGHPMMDDDADWGVSIQLEQIVFVSDRDGGDNIYLTDTEGINAKRLTYDTRTDVQSEISPDGTRIAFMSSRAGDNKDIWVMNIDGTKFKRLTTDAANDEWPTWSPDSKRIAFHTDRDGAGAYEIYVMDALDGGNKQNLTNNPASDSLPAWSPDGLKISFPSTRDNAEWEIYTMNADGTDQTRLTSNNLLNQDPAWSPDSKQIAYMQLGTGTDLDLWVMDADGANQRQLNEDDRSELQPKYKPTNIFG